MKCDTSKMKRPKSAGNKNAQKHGMKGTRIYRIWKAMKTRCLNPNFKRYDRYGGRGIKICDLWMDFLPFYQWAMSAGYSDELSIDRINNDDGYYPENCRWATKSQQRRNYSQNHYVSIDGNIMILTDASKIFEVRPSTFLQKLKYGKIEDKFGILHTVEDLKM